MPDPNWCEGTCYSFLLLAEIDSLIEHQQTAIANRLECRDVTTIEAAGDRGPRRRSGELHFRARARTQPRVGFDERRVAADVEERDRLAGPKQSVRSPARAAAGAAALAAPLDEVDGYGCHCRVRASNVNTRTRPVAPKIRIAICGPRRAAT